MDDPVDHGGRHPFVAEHRARRLNSRFVSMAAYWRSQASAGTQEIEATPAPFLPSLLISSISSTPITSFPSLQSS